MQNYHSVWHHTSDEMSEQPSEEANTSQKKRLLHIHLTVWLDSRYLSHSCSVISPEYMHLWWKPYPAGQGWKIWGEGMGKEASSVWRYTKNTAIQPIHMQKEQPGRSLLCSKFISQKSSCIIWQQHYRRKKNGTVMKNPWNVFPALQSMGRSTFVLNLRCSIWRKIKVFLHSSNLWWEKNRYSNTPY